MIAWFYWNPPREIFKIGNFPIVYYSLFFALGFFIGYYIFFYLLYRFFMLRKFLFLKEDINFELLLKILNEKNMENKIFKEFFLIKDLKKEEILEKINFYFLKKNFTKRKKDYFFLINNFKGVFTNFKKKALKITDKVCFYVIVATVIGARLGHLIFYENFYVYLKDPIRIFKTWEGGLSSHIAAISILFALFLFAKKYKDIKFFKLLDFIAVPASLVACFIRIGNFFNQEILGKKTSFFLAVIFGSPVDGKVFPRHPVQLYEACFYFIVFLVLFYLSFKRKFLLAFGKLFGLFLMTIFSFRFLIEFLKEKQSILIKDSFLLMGQYLSIPLVLLGIVFFFNEKIKIYKKKSLEK